MCVCICVGESKLPFFGFNAFIWRVIEYIKIAQFAENYLNSLAAVSLKKKDEEEREGENKTKYK